MNAISGWALPQELLEAGDILFLESVWLWGLLVAPFLVLALPRARGADRARNLGSLVLRILACWILVVAASRPYSVQREPDLALVVAVDASASMSAERIADVRAVADAYVEAAPPSVDVKWVALGSQLAFDGELPPAQPESGTDLSALVDLALAAAPPARTRKVLLLSDGADTRDSGGVSPVIESATSAGAAGARIYPIPPAVQSGNVGIHRLDLPLEAEAGARVEAELILHATAPTKATLTLKGEEELVSEVLELQVGSTVHRLSFSAPRDAGTWRLEATLDAGDAWPQDDVRGGWLITQKDGPVLVHGPNADVVVAALRNGGVPSRVQADFPKRVAPGAALVLLGPDMESWPKDRPRLLQSWVRDEGVDLVMTGGPSGLGADGDWMDPLDRTLPLAFPRKKKRQPPPLAVVYVIDTSDSMARSRKLDLAVAAVDSSVAMLTPEARVGVLTFADQYEWKVPLTRAKNKEAITESIQTLTVGGGTSVYPAIEEAWKALQATDAVLKHIIVLTDGRGTTRYDQHFNMMEKIGRSQVTVSTVALSHEAAREELEKVADVANGRAWYTETFEDIPRIFVDETMTLLRQNAVEEDTRARRVTGSQLAGAVDWTAAPILGGYNEAKPKPTADLGLVFGDRSQPLLGSWRYGLGTATVFASELGGGWGARWVEWKGLSPWLAALVEAIRERPERKELNLLVQPGPDDVDVVLVALDAVGAPREQLKPELHIRGDQGESTVVMAEEVPGRYRARVAWDGPLLLTAKVPSGAGTPAGVARGQTAPPVPTELAGRLFDLDRLEAIAAASSGSVLPEPRALLTEGVLEREEHRHHWPWLLVASLVALLLDVLVRRLRLPG